jgi:hypothetical protein
VARREESESWILLGFLGACVGRVFEIGKECSEMNGSGREGSLYPVEDFDNGFFRNPAGDLKGIVSG